MRRINVFVGPWCNGNTAPATVADAGSSPIGSSSSLERGFWGRERRDNRPIKSNLIPSLRSFYWIRRRVLQVPDLNGPERSGPFAFVGGSPRNCRNPLKSCTIYVLHT